FVVATLVSLAHAIGLFGSEPQFTVTGGGELQDEASFFRGLFAHQHDILWSIALPDVVLLLAFVALIPLGFAVRSLLGRERAEAQTVALVLAAGGVLGALGQAVDLSQTSYWQGNWSTAEPAVMLAVGRSVDAVGNLSSWIGYASAVVLAVALVYLGRVIRSGSRFPAWVGLIPYALAPALAGPT